MNVYHYIAENNPDVEKTLTELFNAFKMED